MKLSPNIILLGFMGSGKTTTGRELAQLIHFHYWDMDHWIEEKNNKSVSEIFETMGERYFRNEELKALDWARLRNYHVLSLGGGAWLNPNMREAFLKLGWCVWLKVSPEQSYKRVESHLFKRPLLAKEENPKEYMRRLLQQREALYALAHESIDTDQKTPKEVAMELLKSFSKVKPFDLPSLSS